MPDPVVELAPVDYDPFADMRIMVDPLAGKRSIGERADVQNAVKSFGASAVEPFGQLGRVMMGQSEQPFQDLAMAAIGLAAPGRGTAAKLATDTAARMARAEAMGFRTGMPVYHGAGETFSSFRAVPTTAKGMETPGVSVALDPEVANEYAMAKPGNGQANPQVYPLFHRTEKPAVMTLQGNETHGEVVGTLRDLFEGGHDAVMLKNYTTPAGKSGKNIIIVRDPSQLRSPHAMFDLARKFDANLLAGISGMAAFPAAGMLMPVDHDPFEQ